MMGEEDISPLIALGALLVLGVASAYLWARKTRKKARSWWPRIVRPIDEACRQPEHHRAFRR